MKFDDDFEERKAELERRLQMIEQSEEKKKNMEAHISSVFDKSWGEERGMIFMRLNFYIPRSVI